MHNETIDSLAQAAERKEANLNRSFTSHMLLSMLAGMYVGVGIILIFSIGAPLAASDSPFTKLAMGASFGVALTLVIFAGAELFTGNNMIFTLGTLTGQTRLSALGKNWLWTWVGNLLGSAFLAYIVIKAGTFDAPVFRDFVLKVTATKMNLPWLQLFLRGVLANWLVCLAIWQATKTKSDAAKLGLIFWCLFAFIASGFEHSIANMTLLSMGLLLPHGADVSLAGFGRNLAATTLGNVVGGCLFVAFPYWLSSLHRITLRKRAESWGSSPVAARQEVL
jgi:nitrite transporter NirC